MKIKTVIISNTAEAFKEIIKKIKNSKRRQQRVSLEHDLSTRALLWESDDKVVVTPFKLPKEFLELTKNSLGLRNVINLFPKEVGVSLSEAIMHDKELFKRLCDIIKKNPGVNLTAYCATEEFAGLVNKFKNEGLSLESNELPESDSIWTVTYLDSKVGSRTEISKIISISKNVPEGIICRNKKEVLAIANWFINNNRSCVLKANFGESGWGTLFLLKENFKKENTFLNYVEREFKEDSIWEDTLVLVEEYIQPRDIKKGGSPSSELMLSSNGVEITYLCDQEIGEAGDFLGVALGKKNINARIRKEIERISFEIGRRFWKLGYRGFFDIDFVLTDEGIPFVIETNMRRTGGTHVNDLKRKIFDGEGKSNYHLISQDVFIYEGELLDADSLINKLKSVLYPIKGRPKGLIISSISSKNPSFGFVAVGSSRQEVGEIYNKLLSIFDKK